MTDTAEINEQQHWQMMLNANRHLVHIAADKGHTYSRTKFFEKLEHVESLTEAKYLILSLEDMPGTESRGILYDCMDQFFGERCILKTTSTGKIESAKHIREQLGGAILEVFFHSFLEFDPHVPIGQEPAFQTILQFFGFIGDVAKRGYEQRIRAWLRSFCTRMTLTALQPLTRVWLGRALALNGCFEECVNHQVFEAIWYLKVLSLGGYGDGAPNGQKDNQGLISKHPLAALKENHNSHAWITLLRLLAIRGDVTFVYTIDPTDTRSPKNLGEDRTYLRQALIFRPPVGENISGI